MTPGEKRLIDRMKSEGTWQMLEQAFGIEYIPSEAFKRQREVHEKIRLFMSRIQNKIYERRTVIQEETSGLPQIFNPRAAESILLGFYGPRPWSFPLTSTPF